MRQILAKVKFDVNKLGSKLLVAVNSNLCAINWNCSTEAKLQTKHFDFEMFWSWQNKYERGLKIRNLLSNWVAAIIGKEAEALKILICWKGFIFLPIKSRFLFGLSAAMCRVGFLLALPNGWQNPNKKVKRPTSAIPQRLLTRTLEPSFDYPGLSFIDNRSGSFKSELAKTNEMN